MIRLENVAKTFTLHVQDGVRLPVAEGASFHVAPGERAALVGASGAGKSTLMRMIHGNRLAQAGRILVGPEGAQTDVARADPRAILRLRRTVPGHVPQFLRVVPRVPGEEGAAEPLPAPGVDRAAALDPIAQARARGAVIVGIFHDAEARARVRDREVDATAFSPSAPARDARSMAAPA